MEPTRSESPAPGGPGGITADGRPAGALKRPLARSARGAERAICPQADSQPALSAFRPRFSWMEAGRLSGATNGPYRSLQ